MNKKTPFFPSISLVIPLYNNEKTLEPQLPMCIRVLSSMNLRYEVVICNDASTDGSDKILSDALKRHSFLRVLIHNKNQGIAKTIRHLYDAANNDVIVLFSLDGDWDPNDIKRLFEAMRDTHADIVIGKRSLAPYSLYRKCISYSYNALSKIFFGVNTIDAGSIKAFKKSVYQSTKITSKSVFFEAEFIIKAAKKKMHIVSCPIHFRRNKNKKGDGGKVSLVLQSLVDLLRLKMELFR